MKQCKLAPNEKYRELFHPGNLKGVLKPKRNNELLCLRFHTLGYCYPDCKYRSGHGVLSQEEEKQMKEFMHEARRNLQAFQNRKKNIPKEKENDTNSVSLTSNTGEWDQSPSKLLKRKKVILNTTCEGISYRKITILKNFTYEITIEHHSLYLYLIWD